MWQESLSSRILDALAGQLGLLILAAWFLILLLILKELRMFIQTSRRTHDGQDNAMLTMCRESVDNALNYVKSHSDTISELAKIQLSLETQLAELRHSSKNQVSPQQQNDIDELNKKLARAHALVRKLKGDLDKSLEKLKVARRKLYEQYDTVESLQKEREELLQQNQQLSAQLQSGQSPMAMQKLEMTFEQEKQEMLQTLQSYRRQIEEQNQALEQLMVQKDTTVNQTQLTEIKKELAQTQHALKHLSKEKQFIESKYLELVNEHEAGKGA
ncbi:chromosome partitioning protein ParA [Pseudoalteromonas fenneropenaei]|uniref:Chromosome partitioning protein ParA n=1 Tax=Pseudoalteromonas fenneropenaei TaxID=1737459 RepID=A0ABV7CMV5_9GAMM